MAKATASPATAIWPGNSRSHRPPAAIRTRFRHHRRQKNRPAFSRRRRPSATSPKAASSSATTGHLPVQGGQGVPVVYGGTTLKADGTLTGKRLAALVGCATAPAACCNRRTKAGPRPTANEARRELNRAYDRFVARLRPDQQDDLRRNRRRQRHPPHAQPGEIPEDPDAMLVMSLEDYDEVTGKAAKAAIMTKDVVGKTPPVTQVKAPRKGCWSPSTNAARSICRSSPPLRQARKQQIIAELGDLIFPDPESKTWQTADAYLSGNVRAKLAAAERAGPPMPATPKPCGPCSPRTCCPATSTPISARRGYRRATSRHSPPSCSTSSRPSVPVAHLKKDAVWSMEADYAAKASVAATSEFGTPAPTAPGCSNWRST
jgi:hypothetical protein